MHLTTSLIHAIAARWRGITRGRGDAEIGMLLENNPYPQDVRVRVEAESLTAAGWRVEVIAPRAPGQPRRERVGAVEVRRFRHFDSQTGGIAGFVLEYLIAAVALHRSAVRMLLGGARVLHIHNPPDILFPAGALFRAAGRQVVFDHHDLFPEFVEAKVGRRSPVRLARLGERLTFAVASHVLATNESYAEIARSRGGKEPEKVTVVRNAPPEAWLRRPISVRPGVPSPARLGYLGALSTQDGVESLPSLLEHLRAQGLEATLTIVGDGDVRPRLLAELERQQLADRVTFTGWVPWESVPDLLDEIDVCVDPAPATEINTRSTMIKIAEYLALGKPVVAYDLRETRRTAANAAVLVPPGDAESFADAIAALVRDPERRARLASGARKRAVDLTWPHSERALLVAYARLLGPAGPRPRAGAEPQQSGEA